MRRGLLDIRIPIVLLALGTCFAAVAISQWFNRLESRFDALAGLECETALSSFETGGQEKLRSVMQSREAASGLRAWLFDEGGNTLGGGPSRSALLTKESWLTRWLAHLRGQRPGDVWVIEKVGGYSCIVTSDLEHEFHGTRAIEFLAFLAILCCGIAAYVAVRMRRLETAISHFGTGRLEIRVPSDTRDPTHRLSVAFNRMAERIESLVDAHRRLCIDISHELRSPLTRLRLAIGLARSGTRGALNQIELESFRLNDLVDQLLDVARAEVDPTALKKEVIDLRALLAEIADDCAIEARERGCEIDLHADHPGSLAGDVEILRRAIENPLRNAIRHSPSGASVEVTTEGDDDFAVVSIRDRGPGVPESALTEIFRPFYRVESDRDRDTGGAGLGLAITERAIALHNGSVRAQNSSPGLTVEIRLPRK
jgi:two-component system sensor histidine kinase CpxA